jgi:hypothetical protein
MLIILICDVNGLFDYAQTLGNRSGQLVLRSKNGQ